MEQIIREIQDELRSLPKDPSASQNSAHNSARNENTLDKFLQEFILRSFITNAVESIKENARIHNTTTLMTDKYEINKQLITLPKQRELGLQRPILQNILHVYESCMDLFNLMKDMNSYAGEFFRAMYSLIEKHTDYCNQLFLSIVSTGNNE